MNQALKDKIIDLFFSSKMLVLVLATVFLLVGKIGEVTWMEIALVITGLRTASQVMFKHIESKGEKRAEE